MNTRIIPILVFCVCSLIACKKDNIDIGEWLIPKDEVRDGGPGKDGIPALENPSFTTPANASYLLKNDLVLGYVSDNIAKAYPHSILDWHEIINDNINGTTLAITYCPLTGTGIGWDRLINGSVTTFGVSGLLYNSNLIPYDRASNSNWSQMRLDCVNGDLLGTKVSTYQLVETSWETWQEMYPNTTVVSENTGYGRNYGSYPYGDYKTNHSKIIFPVNNTDSRLPNKERVHGILIGKNAKVYSINLFSDTTLVIEDNFNSVAVIVVGNKTKNFIVSFERMLSNGNLLSFEAVQDSLPIILKDNEGTRWDIFGYGVSGVRMGERLSSPTSFIGYWFSWAAFYPDVEIFE